MKQIAVALIFSLIILFPSVGAQASSLTGLATMRAMASESISYQEAIADHKPTLIEFYADWCTTCQSFAPILKQLKQEWGSKVDFVMLNIDDPQWNEQVDRYDVVGVPKLAFLDAQQQLQRSFTGKVPQSILERVLEQLTS